MIKDTLKIISLLSIIVIFSCSICLAQEAYQEGELITLYVGEIKVLSVDNPKRVAISNPEVADVSSVSKHEIVIMAKKAGTTSLIWWDTFGQHALQMQVFVEDMTAIKKRVDSLLSALDLPDVYTRRVDSEGKVLLLGKVKSPEDLERIETALGPLGQKSTNLIKVEEESASIEIDLQVLELNKDETKTLGIEWPSTLELTESSGPISTAVTGWSALFHVSDWTRSAFNTTVNMLVQEGKARILSRPRLVCQSGMEAEFLVGGEKPVLTTTVSEAGGTSGTEVEYKEFGIKLKIRPKVLPENRVQVSLNVEVSEVGTAEILGSAAAPTAKAFPLSKRSTSTQLILDNGQTLAISGLIKQKTEEELTKFPWLADIPILGMFFRKKDVKTGGGRGELGDTELVITLTPTIIAEVQASQPKVEVSPEGVVPEVKVAPEKEVVLAKKVDQKVFKSKRIYTEVSGPAKASYTRKVIKRIRDNFAYPPQAYENKQEGLVNLALHISSAGELLEVKIKQSSGWTILDKNAVRIIKRIAPFPAFPADIKEKELWINIPIAYNIE
jgi:pilus assembly protein CpaC